MGMNICQNCGAIWNDKGIFRESKTCECPTCKSILEKNTGNVASAELVQEHRKKFPARSKNGGEDISDFVHKDFEEVGGDPDNAINIRMTNSIYFNKDDQYDELGIVGGECAFGMNLLKDAFVEIRDVFGGRSRTVQKTLREARQAALRNMSAEAISLGADGVLSVSISYISFSYRSGMIVATATGTAVRILEKGNC